MTLRIGSSAPRWIDRTVDAVADKLLDLDRGRPTKLGGPLETQHWLKENYAEWFKPSPKKDGRYVADPMKWPDPAFGPGVKGTHVFVHNEVTVSGASPEKVLSVLREAGQWSKVCDNLSDVRIEGGGSLSRGTKFSWTTFGTNLNGEVLELSDRAKDPDGPLVFGFRGKDPKTGGKQVDVYHRYLLYPVRDPRSGVVTGTRIVTEESQRGLLTRPLPLVNPNQEKMMLAGHQYLLDCLAEAARR